MPACGSCLRQGFCFADVTTGELVIGQERDDAQRAFLTLLLGAVPAHELLVPQGVLSSATQARLRVGLPAHVCRSELKPGEEFWDAAKTKRQLENYKYFGRPEGGKSQQPRERGMHADPFELTDSQPIRCG